MWHKSQEKIPNLLKINSFGIYKVEIIGFEPMTSCMPCKRSSQLSYTPFCANICTNALWANVLRTNACGECLRLTSPKISSNNIVLTTQFSQRSSNNIVPTTQFQQRSSHNAVRNAVPTTEFSQRSSHNGVQIPLLRYSPS